MKSVTIHQVDDQMARLIKEEADRRGTSMNRTVKALLAQSLGMKPKPEGAHREAFSEFSGLWSKEEALAFSSRVKDFERIDSSDWQ